MCKRDQSAATRIEPRTALRSVALALLALSSCGTGEATPEPYTWEGESAEVAPPEQFDWGGCGIEFTPPPAEWKRQRLQTSLEGVSFRIARVPPGNIDVGHYRLLHREHSSQSAGASTPRHFAPAPADFSLYDVVDRVLFDPETLPQPDTVVIQPEVDRSVDGLAALSVDYSWQDRGQALLGREVYVAAGECLFVARVRGHEADLEVFERLVETLHFPADSDSMP